MRICLVGAPRTGKTQLAGELARHLASQAVMVDGDLSQAATADAVLVMGLDLPGIAGADDADRRLREQLQQAGICYRVVYGCGPARLRSALAALGRGSAMDAGPAAWNWNCEKCGDPDCEHRLFTGLLGRADS